jgi:hypothetical protein
LGFSCLKRIASARIHPWAKAYKDDSNQFAKKNFFRQLSQTLELRIKPYRRWDI